MSYIKTQWVDNVTDIDENNLNKIEQGIYDNSLKLETQIVNTANTSLNDYTDEGWYFFEPPYTPTNIPIGVNGFLEVRKGSTFTKQIWYRAGTPGSNDFQTFVRTKNINGWGAWKRYTVPGDLYWTKTNHEILSKYAGYFVDGVNGNDSNDGKTQATAFKTLAPVWEAVKQGDMEIRFGLAGGSTYVWDPYIINNLSIHIYCYGTGDVTIQMPDEPIAFYDCHINFRGNANQKLIFTGAQKLYLDSGSADLQYIDMQFQYINWGAGSRIKYSNMRDIMCNYSNMYIDTCNISNIYATSSNITFASCIFLTEYSESNIFMELIGCNILIYGPTKVDMRGAVSTGTFMRMTGGHSSQLSAMNAINVQNNVLYNVGLQASGAIIVATTERFNSFSNVATTASSLTNGSICTANL